MKVSHTDQLELLELQKLDQKESALLHKRDSHSAHAMAREFAGRAADLQRVAVTQSTVTADMVREVTRIEDEIAKVTERRKCQQSRVDNNQVPLRDIPAMEHEIVQMNRRLAKLEDDQMEAEECAGAVRIAQDQMEVGAQAIVADIEVFKVQFEDDIVDSDDELRCVIVARREPADRLLADPLEEYEDVCRRNGTLVVIEIRDGYGIGVTADLNPTELEHIRLTLADELYPTEDTAQIIVRTAVNTSR